MSPATEYRRVVFAVLLALVALAAVLQALAVRHRCAEARRDTEAAWSRRHAAAAELAAAVAAAVPGSDAAVTEVLAARAAARTADGLRDRVEREARLGIALARLRACADHDARVRASRSYVLLGLRLGELEEDLAADLSQLTPHA